MDKEQLLKIVHSSHADSFCIILFVKIDIAVMTLCLKTQKRVLGRSAGASKGMASNLLSHGFGAVVQDSGMENMCRFPHGFGAMVQDSGMETMFLSHGFGAGAHIFGMLKGAALPTEERHMLSDIEEGSCEDGVNTKDNAWSKIENEFRCDDSYPKDKNARCKLGTGGVVCPSIKDDCCAFARQHSLLVTTSQISNVATLGVFGEDDCAVMVGPDSHRNSYHIGGSHQ